MCETSFVVAPLFIAALIHRFFDSVITVTFNFHVMKRHASVRIVLDTITAVLKQSLVLKHRIYQLEVITTLYDVSFGLTGVSKIDT